MASGDRPQDRQVQPSGAGPSPVDVPAARPAGLRRLEVLVGGWDTEALFPFDPPVTVLGRTTFEWLEGGFFLIQRWTIEHPDAPDGIAVIGTASGETFSQRYFDSRGVHRTYEMSLNDGVWRLWRDSPGFAQRFAGRLCEDSATFEGAWEKSQDGSHWEHDFDLTYRRIG
jgi:hypothetical protein